MAEQPNDASRKSKAEGERWGETPEKSDIADRPLEDERSNQESLPPRGEGTHAGHGDSQTDDRRSER
jgi:hypothetical protein